MNKYRTHTCGELTKLDNKIVDYIIKRIARSYSKMHEFIYKIDEISLKKRKSINFKIIKEIVS